MKRAIIECFVLLAVGVGLLIAQSKVAQDAPSDHGPPASKDGTPCDCVWNGEEQNVETEVVDESLLWQPDQYGVAFDTIKPTIDLSTDNSVTIDLGDLENTTEIPRSASRFYPSYPIYPSCVSHRGTLAMYNPGTSITLNYADHPFMVDFHSIAEIPVIHHECNGSGSGLNDVCEGSN